MRHQLTQQALLRAVARFGRDLGDAEVVVDTSDGYSEMAGPVLVMSKFPSSSGGVLSPRELQSAGRMPPPLSIAAPGEKTSFHACYSETSSTKCHCQKFRKRAVISGQSVRPLSLPCSCIRCTVPSPRHCVSLRLRILAARLAPRARPRGTRTSPSWPGRSPSARRRASARTRGVSRSLPRSPPDPCKARSRREGKLDHTWTASDSRFIASLLETLLSDQKSPFHGAKRR